MSKGHFKYLNNLVRHLDLIDEDIEKARWVMKEGIYLRDKSIERLPFCDIIIGYDDYCVPAELKKSTKQRGHARQQIESGRQFIESILKLNSPYAKFVIYGGGGYEYETIPFKNI